MAAALLSHDIFPNIVNYFLPYLCSGNPLTFIEQDGTALVRAMVSKEAIFFRQQVCRVIADIIYQWMFEALGQRTTVSGYNSRLNLATAPDNKELRSSSQILDYRNFLGDRRIKVIFLKVLNSASKDRILMLRLCWTSFVMVVTASALACQRMLISLSKTYLGPVSFASKRFAVTG